MRYAVAGVAPRCKRWHPHGESARSDASTPPIECQRGLNVSLTTGVGRCHARGMAGSLVAEVQLVRRDASRVPHRLLRRRGRRGRRRLRARPPDRPSTPAATSTAGDLEDVVAAVQGRLDLYRAATHGFAVLVRVGDEKRVLVSGTADVAARRPSTARRPVPDRQHHQVVHLRTRSSPWCDDGRLLARRHGRATVLPGLLEARPTDHRRAAAQPSQRAARLCGSSSTDDEPQRVVGARGGWSA